MFLAIIAAMALVSTPITPENGVVASTNAPPGWQPPVKYQRDILAIVDFQKQSSVNTACLGKIATNKISACAIGNFKIIIGNPCTKYWETDEYALSLCHEIGHLNGWDGMHTQGHWVKGYGLNPAFKPEIEPDPHHWDDCNNTDHKCTNNYMTLIVENNTTDKQKKMYIISAFSATQNPKIFCNTFRFTNYMRSDELAPDNIPDRVSFNQNTLVCTRDNSQPYWEKGF